MTIEWTDVPDTKAEIPRGKPWTYRLPIKGPADDVRWQCRALPLSALEPDPACPERITVHVPADLEILFGELTWQVSAEGSDPAHGRLLFRVVEPREWRAATSPATPTAAAETYAASAPEPSRTSSLFIEVLRGGATVAGLRAEVRQGRTMTIGRGGQLADHDLDLTGRFETEDLEICCSRRQAEVFTGDDGVFIRCIGNRPLKLVDSEGNPGDDISGDHRWSIGELLALPGKLRLVLREGPR